MNKTPLLYILLVLCGCKVHAEEVTFNAPSFPGNVEVHQSDVILKGESHVTGNLSVGTLPSLMAKGSANSLTVEDNLTVGGDLTVTNEIKGKGYINVGGTLSVHGPFDPTRANIKYQNLVVGGAIVRPFNWLPWVAGGVAFVVVVGGIIAAAG